MLFLDFYDLTMLSILQTLASQVDGMNNCTKAWLNSLPMAWTLRVKTMFLYYCWSNHTWSCYSNGLLVFIELRIKYSNSTTRISHPSFKISNYSKMSSNIAFDLDIPHHPEVIERALVMHKNMFMSSKKVEPQSCVYSLLRLWFQCIHQDQACRL